MSQSGTLESNPHLTVFSLGQAAKEVGKSKTTISRAINSGKISAAGNSESGYQIEPCELFRVFKRVTPEQPLRSAPVDVALPHVTLGETLVLQAQLEAKQQECSDLRERLVETKESMKEIKNAMGVQVEDARSERDKWQEQARSVQLLLDHKSAVDKTPKRSSWPSMVLGFLFIISIALLLDRVGGFQGVLGMIKPLI